MGNFLKEIKFQDSLVEPLRVLLMTIQAISWKKDKSLMCVLVFTHLDEIVKVGKATCKIIENINEKFETTFRKKEKPKKFLY